MPVTSMVSRLLLLKAPFSNFCSRYYSRVLYLTYTTGVFKKYPLYALDSMFYNYHIDLEK